MKKVALHITQTHIFCLSRSLSHTHTQDGGRVEMERLKLINPQIGYHKESPTYTDTE